MDCLNGGCGTQAACKQDGCLHLRKSQSPIGGNGCLVGESLQVDGSWPDGSVGQRDDDGGSEHEEYGGGSGSFTDIIGIGFCLSLVLLFLALLKVLTSFVLLVLIALRQTLLL